VIALVEEQVQRAVHDGQTLTELGVGELEEALRAGEGLLATSDPLLDGGAAGEECAGDLGRAKAAEDVQDQRDLHLFGEARMTTGKHHPQLFVSNRRPCEGFVDGWHERPF
jgi:hypothetical protein